MKITANIWYWVLKADLGLKRSKTASRPFFRRLCFLKHGARTPSQPDELHTFVSSISGPGGSPRGSGVVRVAVASVDVLIVVLPRLRRPELSEAEGWRPTRFSTAALIWQALRTWRACCGSSAAAAARTRLGSWAAPRRPSEAAGRPEKEIIPPLLKDTFISEWRRSHEAAEMFGSH